jgi:hypothetical protein
MQMRVYSYVIVSDNGGAPNFDGLNATLALCKPKIRIRAQPGELVLAFTGSSLGPEPHSVRWAGIVAECLTFSDYWNDERFACKKPGAARMPDNIYRPSGSALIQVPNVKHGPESISRDLGGQYVLVFDPAWHFGPSAPLLPDRFGLRMIGSRRAHRVTEISAAEGKDLRKWLDGQQPAPVSWAKLDSSGQARPQEHIASVPRRSRQTC